MKPKVLISSCLGFENSRYNGGIISNSFIDKLKDYIEPIIVCPEMEMGLGVPRESIRLVSLDNKTKLMTSRSGIDLTDKAEAFIKKFDMKLSNNQFDGAMLKSLSPSCGIRNVKLYNGTVASKKGKGFFGSFLYDHDKVFFTEEEGRCNDRNYRENFLTAIYASMKYRNVTSMAELIKFHSEHKYLYMSYNYTKLKEMGKLLASHSAKNFEIVYVEYRKILTSLFKKLPNIRSRYNTMQHMVGYFKNDLSSIEKEFLANLFTEYRNSLIPFNVPLKLLEYLVVKYNKTYLTQQVVFNTFPKELQILTQGDNL
ncbi:MAG: DUF523 and DUF1722 domain-containing protein [Candidatus Delongbacteria bacterium]|nr:DUF523 and DUF1722 domain-containing protein [Candidatus Delongbacteria bacterium]MBN2835444.1 DUF523 and DUF1722 domain-containing protein [Candidatus Delongbacteria bacterium]